MFTGIKREKRFYSHKVKNKFSKNYSIYLLLPVFFERNSAQKEIGFVLGLELFDGVEKLLLDFG